MNPRTGRPLSDNPKSTQLAVRLDKNTLEKLDFLVKEYGETRVQVIRRGIESLYKERVK